MITVLSCSNGSNMWRLTIALLAVILIPALGYGQQISDAWYNIFVAPGFASPEKTGTLHFGFENRAVGSHHIGAGFGLGYLAPMNSFNHGGRGFFSIDGSYHFYDLKKSPKLAPFMELGYTHAFGPGSGNLINYGAAVNYWICPWSGVHIGVRDYYHPRGPSQHITEFKIGWVFLDP
jgi:hypothetical protein